MHYDVIDSETGEVRGHDATSWPAAAREVDYWTARTRHQHTVKACDADAKVIHLSVGDQEVVVPLRGVRGA